MIYTYNLKQFNVQIISILEEIDSFYFQKVPKNLGRPPSPPSFGQNPKEEQFFLSRKPSLRFCLDTAGLDLDWERLPPKNMTLGSVPAFLEVLQTIVKDALHGDCKAFLAFQNWNHIFFSFLFFISESERWEVEAWEGGQMVEGSKCIILERYNVRNGANPWSLDRGNFWLLCNLSLQCIVFKGQNHHRNDKEI